MEEWFLNGPIDRKIALPNLFAATQLVGATQGTTLEPAALKKIRHTWVAGEARDPSGPKLFGPPR